MLYHLYPNLIFQVPSYPCAYVYVSKNFSLWCDCLDFPVTALYIDVLTVSVECAHSLGYVYARTTCIYMFYILILQDLCVNVFP